MSGSARMSDEVGGTGQALRSGQQVGEDVAQGAGLVIGAHERDLGAGKIKDPGADGMAFGGVGVKQALGGVAVGDGGEFPAQVVGVAETEVEALSAER